MEQLELLYFTSGNAKRQSHTGKQMAGSYELRPTPTTCLSQAFAEKEKILYGDIYNSFSHSCRKLEIIRMSFKWWMDKQAVSYSCPGKALNNKEEWTTSSRGLGGQQCILLSERSQSQKATCWIVPCPGHSGKGKIDRDVRPINGAPRARGEGRADYWGMGGGKSLVHSTGLSKLE